MVAILGAGIAGASLAWALARRGRRDVVVFDPAPDFQRACGLPIEHPDPQAIVPWLDTNGIHGANFCSLDGQYIPLDVLGCYVEEARELGVDFRLGREAHTIGWVTRCR